MNFDIETSTKQPDDSSFTWPGVVALAIICATIVAVVWLVTR